MLLPGRRLRLSARPGQLAEPVILDDASLVPEAVAGWRFAANAGGSRLGAIELVLDLDLDAPAPPGVEPVSIDKAGALMTLSPTLAEFDMVVLAGPGVVRAGQVDALRAFAAQAGVGVVNTWGAKGVFPWDGPHHYGTVGLQQRDFELAGFDDHELVVAVGLDPAESPTERWAHRQVLEVEPWQLAALAYNWPEPGPVPPVPRLYTDCPARWPIGPRATRPPRSRRRGPRPTCRRCGAMRSWSPIPAPPGCGSRGRSPPPRRARSWCPRSPRRASPWPPPSLPRSTTAARYAVTTSPFDPTTQALLDLAASVGSSFVLCEWGADVDWADANAHKVALRSTARGPGHRPRAGAGRPHRHPPAGRRRRRGRGMGRPSRGDRPDLTTRQALSDNLSG